MKGILCLAEKYFSLRMVERDFLSCGNRFLLFEFFFLQVETFTEISGKKLFGKDFVPVERDFPLSGTCFFPARGNRYWN